MKKLRISGFHCFLYNKSEILIVLYESNFTMLSTLNKYMRTHPVEKPFPCYSFESTISINSGFKHHTIINTGERHFWYKDFQSRFSHGSHLKECMLIYFGEEPYHWILGVKIFQEIKSHDKAQKIFLKLTVKYMIYKIFKYKVDHIHKV